MPVSITQLVALKTRIPEVINNSQDKLLTQLLEDAESAILDYTNRTVLTSNLEPLQREIALIYYNRIGSEGVASESQGKISRSYESDLPANIKARLNKYRVARFR